MEFNTSLGSRRKSLNNNEERKRTNSFLKESIRVGSLYAIAKTTLSSVSRKGSTSTRSIALIAATGIALATNDETDNGVTLGGAALMLGGKKAFKRLANDNVSELSKGVATLNHHLGEWSKVRTDIFQRYKEFKNVDTKRAGRLSRFIETDAYKKKSNAWVNYQKNKKTYNNLYATKSSSYGTGTDKNFIDNMIKKDKAGYGPFKEMMRYTNYDAKTGSTSFDTDNLFKKGTDVGNIRTYFNSNYTELTESIKADKNFNFMDFLDNKSNSESASEFDKAFGSYYNKLISNKDSGKVTVGSLSEKQPDVLVSLIEKFSIDTDGESLNIVKKLLGDVEIKNLGKDKAGNIFDRTLLDPSAMAIDAMTMVEKALRPAFSFLPGENSTSFSLIPFDLKGMKQKRGKSDFSIFEAAENIDGSISNLKSVQNIIDNSSLGPGSNKLEKLETEIATKLDELTRYRDQYGPTRRGVIPDEDFKSIGHSFRIVEPEGKPIKLMETSSSFIAGFKTEDGTVSYLTKGSRNEWVTLDGAYDISYDRILKENQARSHGQYMADSFTSKGNIHEKNYYYGDTILEKSKRVYKKNTDRFRTDKQQDVLNRELGDFIGRMDQRKNAFYENLSKAFVGREDDILASFGKRAQKVDIFDRSELENFLRKQSTIDISRGIDTIGFDKSQDTLRMINVERGVKDFFDLGDIETLNDITDSNLFKNAIKEDFVSRSLKAGIGETVKNGVKDTSMISSDYLGDYKELTESFFQSSFINQATPSSRATLTRRVGSRGGTSALGDLNFDDNIGTVQGAYLNEFFNKMDQSMNYIGARKIDEVLGTKGMDGNTSKVTDNFMQIMTNRVAPFIVAGYALQALDGATDMLLPGDLSASGAAAASYAAMRIGFQAMMEFTGIQGAANFLAESGFGGFIEPLELNLSSDEMYARYFEGKEIEMKRGRFWFGGNRTSFGGTDTEGFQQHFLYRKMNRTTGIYNSKSERFIREDFLPTKLLSRVSDPYLEERRLSEKGYTLDKSEQLFTELPIIGEFLANSIGQIIKPTQYYGDTTSEINPWLSSFDKAFEDIKTMGGYQGYSIGAASNFLLGGPTLKDIVGNNSNIETRKLASLDRATSMTEDFYNLNVGGMLGMTEPIRRVFTNNSPEVYSNMMINTGQEWFDDAVNEGIYNGNLSTLDLLKDSSLAPGLGYDFRYGVSDRYSDTDKLRILGNVAPHSENYREVESNAENALAYGGISNSTAKDFKRTIDLRDSVANKDTSIDNAYVGDTSLINMEVNVSEVLSHNEFLSDGKRYKLAGIEDSFNTISNRIGESAAMDQTAELRKAISSSGSLSVVANKDALSAVKTDNDGEYIEVFSDKLSNDFSALNSDTYLKTMSGSSLGKAGAFLSQSMRNVALPAQTFLNKTVTGRDAYTQWYRESQQMPAFRSWETPYDSFINPMMNLSQNSSNALLLKGTLSGMYGGNALTDANEFLVGGMALNAIGGSLGLTGTPSAYAKEDDIQMEIERNKSIVGQQNIFDTTTHSSYSQLKSSLSTSERDMYHSLINEVSEGKRSQIYDAASDRFKRVIDISHAKQFNYVSDQNIQIHAIDTYDMNFKKTMDITNDYFYNLTSAKVEAGYSLTSLDKRKLRNRNLNKINQQANVSDEERRRRVTGGTVSSKVVSTIFGNNQFNYLY